MAERVTKTRECDHLKCRARSTVKEVRITYQERDIGADEWESSQEFQGELCLVHRRQGLWRAARLFENSKDYPEEVIDNG